MSDLSDLANRLANSISSIHDRPSRRKPMTEIKTLEEIKAELCGMLVTDKTNVRLLEFLGDAFEAGQCSMSSPHDATLALMQKTIGMQSSEIGRLKAIVRVNLLRLSPSTSHSEIDALIAGNLVEWRAAWDAFCAVFPAYAPPKSKAFPFHGKGLEFEGGNMSGSLS